jgi:glycosyltransferase involved in cell wall biosynthesis
LRVGVYIGNIKPDKGGGHTFEEDIINALVEMAPKSNHTFIILTESAPSPLDHHFPPNFMQFNLQDFRSIQNNKGLSLRPSKFYNNAIARKILKIFRSSRETLITVDEIVRDIGLDIIWNLTPVFGIYPSSTPFISIVWDLQHRLQPWFPEVSAHGRWNNREKRFSQLRRASFVIAGTEAGKLEIINFYQVPSERIKLIPHPTPQFALIEKSPNSDTGFKKLIEKYNIPPGYLFYPAQFWSHKNHVNLVHALSILRKKHGLTLPLVFVGSDQGNESHVREVVRQLNLCAQVYFLGFVPEEDLVLLYQNAFALTYVSFFGPENLPPLEAFALGCPVISADVPGAEEQLGDSALLVDPKDENNIAEAIKSLHDDPVLRKKLVTIGKVRASNWTSKDFVNRVFSLLDEFESIRRCWD